MISSAETPKADPECLHVAANALQQGEILLGLIDRATYTRPVPKAFNATIGGHYRHVLDHFQIVLDAVESRVADYGKRAREQALENCPSHALERTRNLAAQFAAIETNTTLRAIRVTDLLSAEADGSAAGFPSSIARETLYAVHHAIHHFALIRVMGQLMGIRFPEDFGVAISTLHHRRRASTQCEVGNEDSGLR